MDWEDAFPMGCRDADLIERTKKMQKGHHRRVCLGSCKIDTTCRLTKHTLFKQELLYEHDVPLAYWKLRKDELLSQAIPNSEVSFVAWPHKLPVGMCWHAWLVFHTGHFSNWELYVNFSLVPLQEQKIENCNSFPCNQKMDSNGRCLASHRCLYDAVSECISTKPGGKIWADESDLQPLGQELRVKEPGHFPSTVESGKDHSQPGWTRPAQLGLGFLLPELLHIYIYLLVSLPRRYPRVSPW